MSITTTTGGEPKWEANPMDRLPQLLTNAPLCQAHNRAGKSCRCPAARGKRVCRVHGGAKGSGAPRGERNGSFKHGGFTKDAIELRRTANLLLQDLSDV